MSLIVTGTTSTRLPSLSTSVFREFPTVSSVHFFSNVWSFLKIQFYKSVYLEKRLPTTKVGKQKIGHNPCTYCHNEANAAIIVVIMNIGFNFRESLKIL